MILAISILLGIIPAIIVFITWKRYVYFAFKLPIMVEVYLRLIAALHNAYMAIRSLSEAVKMANVNLPRGGVLSNDNNSPEYIIPRNK